ncbi:MAG: hypothetical protein EXR54_08195 [Dehalococcoidia bacterium]|nr:hypothetical protein [Dehalococcoidia bacterium]MSQ17521.1 hypothetical protein [Dehalococcoidia bacterium]
MSPSRVFGFKDHVLYVWQFESQQVRRYVDLLAGDLSEEELNWQARPGHHSMWHHIWHMFLSRLLKNPDFAKIGRTLRYENWDGFGPSTPFSAPC